VLSELVTPEVLHYVGAKLEGLLDMWRSGSPKTRLNGGVGCRQVIEPQAKSLCLLPSVVCLTTLVLYIIVLKLV